MLKPFIEIDIKMGSKVCVVEDGIRSGFCTVEHKS